jgi:hypothetical protein
MARSPAGLIVSLRSALQDDAARLRSRANPALLKSKLDDEVRRVCERFAEGGSPPEAADLALLLRRFRKAAAENTLDQFSRREWKQVCWGMFAPPDPLAEQAAFLEALLARLCDGPSRGLCRTLISVYLAQFDPAPRSMQTIAQALAQLVPQWDWSWAERQRRFSLFEPGKAPLEVAKHCTAPNASLEAKLEEAGVKGICRFGGMEAAAFGAGLRLMRYSFENRPTSQASPRMERTIAWYEKALAEGGSLAFQAQRPAMASVLLLPWQERAPEDALRERITEVLLKHFKDPRIHPQNWLKVPDEATAVLRRWLTRIALEQFFEVVDQVAERGQWMYRRPFWMSYYKEKVIDDAWVLFGPAARRLATTVLDDGAAFGLIRDPRLQSHCILLLRVGGLTVADVSHNGKCRIWRDGNGHAPPLYRKAYGRVELEDGPDLEQVHWGSSNYRWQGWVSGFIRSATGIAVNETHWRPS